MTTVTVRFPTDGGFLRRECPSCRRQFKQRHAGDASGTHSEPLHCPYCGRGASGSEKRWWTQAQRDFAEKTIAHKAVGPQLAEIDKMFKNLGKGSKSIKVTTKGSMPRFPAPLPLHEPSDMRVLTPPCHPDEPMKIKGDWQSAVHCIVCGAQFQGGDAAPKQTEGIGEGTPEPQEDPCKID